MFGTLARGLTLLARIVGRTGPARARTRRHACPRFCVGGRGKPASFADGSASGSGDRPGLQNRWHVLRGMFGGFDSHALPPLRNLNASRVLPRGMAPAGPVLLVFSFRLLPLCAAVFRHMSGTRVSGPSGML